MRRFPIANHPDLRRRLLLQCGGTLIALPTLAARAAEAAVPAASAPTPAQTEGPFYPRVLPADRDADLTQVVVQGGDCYGGSQEVATCPFP